MTDQELQELVEHGASPDHSDSNSYQAVFKAIRREPDFVLPAHFADRVVDAVRSRYSSNDMAWFLGGLFLFVIALVVAVLITGFSVSLGAFTFLSGYPGLVGFGVAFILGLHWVDRKWIRKPAA